MSNAAKYIAGMGNYSRNDDGIGLRVVEYIVEHDLDRDCRAVEIGNDGLRLLTLFTAATRKILIVDCALMERKPGEFTVFSPEQAVTQKTAGTVSTHEGDLMKLLEFAAVCGLPIPEIKILAVQPESLEMGMALSPVLRKKLPEIVEAALNEIRK